MARFTFGGTYRDLNATPNPGLSNALVVASGVIVPLYLARTGGTPVTDFYLDNDGDGLFETASTSVTIRGDGYWPEFQGPDGVSTLYLDPDPNDAEVRRVLVIARDSNSGGVQPATTTVAGIAALATTTEVTTGTNNTKTVTPLGVATVLTDHVNAANPHPGLSSAVADLQAQQASALTVDPVTGLVPLNLLPVSEGAVAGTIAVRGSQGQIAGGTALVDADLPNLAQVRQLVAVGPSGSDVRNQVSTAVGLSAASASTFTTLTTSRITDAASGQQWRCEYSIFYTATTAAGLQVRHKTATAAPTNKITNPSFETDTTGYTAGNSSTTITRGTTGGGFDGLAYGIMTTVNATAATNVVHAEFAPCTPGSTWSAGAYVRTGSGTARNVRVDVLFSDATGSRTIVGGTVNGTVVTPTATWAQAKSEGAVAPAWATQVSVRMVMLATAVAGDTTRWDAVQLEPGATLPAYGSTGGSGPSSMTFLGEWFGLTNAATNSDGYSKRVAIRYPDVSNLTAAFGGLGATTDAILNGSFLVTVGGTGLINQRIELEFAQRVTDAANPTQVVAATATFARVV